jgi:hypothetical protein
MAQPLDGFLAGIIVCHQLRWVAGNHANDEKDDYGNAQQCGDE